MKRISLNQKVNTICKHGTIKQLTINDLDGFVISKDEFIESINKGMICFSYRPNEGVTIFPFVSYMQCVNSFNKFVENIYLSFKV